MKTISSILFILLFLSTGKSFAQTTESESASTSQTTLSNEEEQAIEFKSPLSFNIYLTTETSRDENLKINGSNSNLYNFINYNFSNLDQITLTPAFSLRTGGNEKTKGQFDTAELKYKRDKILAEGKIGFNLSAEVRAVYYANKNYRAEMNRNANYQIRANLDRKITDHFNIASIFQYQIYDRTKSNVSNPNFFSRMILIPSYELSDKWSLSSWVLFTHLERVGKSDDLFKKDDEIEIVPSINFNISKNTQVSAFLDMVPFKSHDNRYLASDFTKQTIYGLSLYSTIF